MTEFWSGWKAVDSWLIRIYFPGMDVKYKRFLLFFVNAPQTPPDNGIREEPEIAAAAYWEILAKNFHGVEWEFDKAFWVNGWMS